MKLPPLLLLLALGWLSVPGLVGGEAAKTKSKSTTQLFTREQRNALAEADDQQSAAEALEVKGRYREAEPLFRQTGHAYEKAVGPEHPRTLHCRLHLALALYYLDRLVEAVGEFRSLVPVAQRVLGPTNPDAVDSRLSFAAALVGTTQYAEAEQEARAVLVLLEQAQPVESARLIRCHTSLALALAGQERPAEALDFAKRALKARLKSSGEDHPDTEKSRKLVDFIADYASRKSGAAHPPESLNNAVDDKGNGKGKDLATRARDGDPQAQAELGDQYADGAGVKKDMATAFHWWLMAAEAGNTSGQVNAAWCYSHGTGVVQSFSEALRWDLKAAAAGCAAAMYNIGMACERGQGMPKKISEALSWYEKSANAGFLQAQSYLGALYGEGTPDVGQDREASCKWYAMGAAQDDANCLYMLGIDYVRGEGVPHNTAQGVRMWRRAAEQGFPAGQYKLGTCYITGTYAVRDYEEAYYWFKLAANQGYRDAAKLADSAQSACTKKQLAEARDRIKSFVPRLPRPVPIPSAPKGGGTPEHGTVTGTGFFITRDGYLVTNHHVVNAARSIHVVLGAGTKVPAQVMVKDKKADLAILKVSGIHPFLAITSVRGVKLGATVATVGFPNPNLQGFSPKLAKGEVASLAGIQDDPSQFQISVPLQPGNSGGALVDAQGNVVGVVCAILNQRVALATTGTLANSVAYAVKSSLLMNLVESVPGLGGRLVAPATQLRPFEDIVADVEHATVLIVVEE